MSEGRSPSGASSPCAGSAGTGMGSPILERECREDSLSLASSNELAEKLESLMDPVALSDPYLGVYESSPNRKEPAGAGSDPSPLQPSPSNLAWAEFSEPGALGCSLVEGAVTGATPQGMDEYFNMVKHNASTDASCRRQGLFPLPVSFKKPTEGSPSPVSAWTDLICLALNKLAGWKGPLPSQRKGQQSVKAVQGIQMRVERFLQLFKEETVNPMKLWEDLKKKKLSYDGEEYTEPVPLTLNQIETSLPPAGHGGSVDLVPLLVGRTRHLLQHPAANLLEKDMKEPGSNVGKVHINPGEELGVWNLLKERGVTDWLPLSEVYRDTQGPFLSGLFGVEKPNKFATNGAPLLRVIMNLKPINRALRIIKGDIKELPMATNWTQMCLLETETVHVSQADMSSAFYLFRLPSCWRPYLCFNTKVDGSRIGLRPGVQYVPTCVVLPMGWSSSVGLMQMASRELIRRGSQFTATELHRQMIAPPWFVNLLQRAGKRQFWQVYLDNYMAGEVGPKSSAGEGSVALHQEAVGIWTREGVLCAEDKHVLASQEAVELGVALNGKEGLVGGGPQRFHQLLAVTLLLLGERNPKVKWVQIVLGRWIFILQYRRPAMATLSRCWNYMRKGQDRRRWWPVVREEMSTLLCLTPLLQFDLRMEFSDVVTCSDASHHGGAVAAALGLSRAGRLLCQRAESVAMEPHAADLLVVSVFNGIGGAFRGYDIAGVRPQGLVAIEWDKAAQRITRKAWPQVIEVKDVEEVDKAMVEEWFNAFPRVQQVDVIGGFPCVHLSAVRAGRMNLSGEGSKLFWNLVQLIKWVEEVFSPTAAVEFEVENVLSMDAEAREEISQQLGVEPLALCPSDVLPYNRPRLAWVSSAVEAGEGVTLERQSGYTRVHMAAEPVPDAAWVDPGWRRCCPEEKLPTFMKAISRQRPPPKPAGISRCEPEALQRWASDAYRFPPYQYQRKFLLINDDRDLRYPSAAERERLLGFGEGHTIFALAAGKAKEDPTGYNDKRLSVLGDSFSMLSFGWVISQLCKRWVKPLTPQEVLDRMGLAPGASLDRNYVAVIKQELGYGGQDLGEVSVAALTAQLSRQVNHTGSDVSISLGIPFTGKTQNHVSLRADWWEWRILFITKWKHVSHINDLEMRMILQSIKWRARKDSGFNSRWLHLADSMVSNFILSKGRTSSKLLQPLTREIAAYLLALNSHQLQGHVDSIENPTDAASRSTPN